MVKPVSPPICPYCGGDAVLVAGSVIYGDRRDQDLAEKKFWYCAGDQAWVGCHAKTEKPLGRLADSELRAAKQAAHAVFDPLWQARQRVSGLEKFRARGRGYKWLAEQMGIPTKLCHIGMFDIEQCRRVVEICTPFTRKLRKS